MDFSKMKSLSVGGVALKQLFINGVQVWKKRAYTNLIDKVGYTDGVRLSTTSGGETAEPNHTTTGFIWITGTDVIRTDGVDFNFVSGSKKSAYVIYRADKTTKVTSGNVKDITSGGVSCKVDSEGNIVSWTGGLAVPSGGGYLRLCGYGSGENLIVTVNEEIT